MLLSVLELRPAHGYAIIDELRSRSGDTFDLPEGTIYPALHRLEQGGLLSSHWAEQAGRRRRLYRLTRRGHRALARERQSWRSFSRAVGRVLRPAL